MAVPSMSEEKDMTGDGRVPKKPGVRDRAILDKRKRGVERDEPQ
jgi:hypothetical protein